MTNQEKLVQIENKFGKKLRSYIQKHPIWELTSSHYNSNNGDLYIVLETLKKIIKNGFPADLSVQDAILWLTHKERQHYVNMAEEEAINTSKRTVFIKQRYEDYLKQVGEL